MDETLFQLIQTGKIANPHGALGLLFVDPKKQVIRLWRPNAENCLLEICGKKVEAAQVDPSGLYEYEVSSQISPTDYQIYHPIGKLAYDPYSFGQIAGELDIHLASQGLHYELYNLLGATLTVHEGVSGVHFALWAPNAVSVFLMGDFNKWNQKANPMRSLGDTGIWEIFVPGLSVGEAYQYLVVTSSGEEKVKADPVAHFSQLRPSKGSVVADVDRFSWSDEDFLHARGKHRQGNAPIAMYEVHPGSWKRKDGELLNYREMAHRLADYCTEMHFTHVELMGICEHPLDESWGYQVTGYFAPTSRYGSVEDFQYLVNHLHSHHIGVILDWVPAHFPIDDHALALFDGTFLYEHLDPRQGYHPDWNTHIFNYGRWEVSNFLIASALFWLEKMHIDGLRVDAVASMIYLDYGKQGGEWVPNHLGTNINFEAIEFMKHMNSIIHQRVPDALMIAEESTSFAGVTKPACEDGLGFDLKWSLGWMHDTLSFFSTEFEKREEAIHRLTLPFSYGFTEKFVLVLSHDEVVHGKGSLFSRMVGNEQEKFASMRQLFTWFLTFPGKKLLFMGGEMGQTTEWNCKEELPWNLLLEPAHEKLHEMVSHLNQLYLKTPALYLSEHMPESCEQLDPVGENPLLIGYLRKAKGECVYILQNFSNEAIENVQIPFRCEVLFNSDNAKWGGSGRFDEKQPLSIAPLSSLILSASAEKCQGD